MNKLAMLDDTNHQLPRSATRMGKLVVNLDTRIVSVDDRAVRLTRKEYAILELFALREDTIVTREMLLDHLYGGTEEPELKIIDVFVCKLRKKLAQAANGNDYLETVWGRGYVLRDSVVTHGTNGALPSTSQEAFVASGLLSD